ncbi:MAG: type II toxin-antitoxin system RelE/ParE family toxin [Methylococcaceae bacterium]|nr:type II toxin-antitoxin system RelE/ParE family toxin [Methylococcaceae bacterium]
MKIEWSARSRTDLKELKNYIGQDSPYYARRFIARIILSVEKLEDFPDIGRGVPEAEERNDVRELIFQGYRIIYLRQSDHVYIVTVIHGSRDLSGMNDKPWDVG